VALHNRTASRTTDTADRFGGEGTFIPARTAEEFVRALERPRRVERDRAIPSNQLARLLKAEAR